MKFQVWCDNGANIHSRKTSKVFDLEKELGIDDEEWAGMTENERNNTLDAFTKEWALLNFDYDWKEV